VIISILGWPGRNEGICAGLKYNLNAYAEIRDFGGAMAFSHAISGRFKFWTVETIL
jgi:hypothetical protein